MATTAPQKTAPNHRRAALEWLISSVNHSSQLAEKLWKKQWFGWMLVAIFGFVWACWRFIRIPAPGKSVAMLAAAAAVMTFRENMHGREKFVWCLVLIGFLTMEFQSIDRDRNEALRTQADMLTSAQETAKDAHETLVRVNGLPQLISEKDAELMEAEKKHDPMQIARLQAEKKALERQRFLELTVELHEEMRTVSDSWSAWDQHLQFESSQSIDPTASETEKQTVIRKAAQTIDDFNAEMTRQVQPLFIKSDKVRQNLLALVPSRDNRTNDAIYAKVLAGQTINWLDMQDATNYLNDLYFAAIKQH